MIKPVGSLWIFVLFVLCANTPTHAALFRVGADAACTHRNLDDAIADAERNGPNTDEIRVAMNQHHGGGNKSFIIDQSVRIVGGYLDCSATSQTGYTMIDGYPHGHFAIATQAARRSFVELNRLYLTGSGGPIVGGSLEIYGNVDVTVRDSLLVNNRADRGGAVYIDGMKFPEPARLTLIGTDVNGNRSRFAGGGIDCHGGAQIVLKSGSRIQQNESLQEGGGVSLESCNWWQGGGTRVTRNKAGMAGGGIYAWHGSYLFTTWATDDGVPAAPAIDFNQADLRGGGGIALYGAGTYLDARGLALVGNVAQCPNNGSADGAALIVGVGATAWLHRDERCKAGAICSLIAVNAARSDPGWASIVHAEDNALVVIAQTDISGNYTYVGSRIAGSLFSVGGEADSSRIVLRNSLVDYNQNGYLFLRSYPGQDAFEIALSTFKSNQAGAMFDATVRNGPMLINMAASVIDGRAPLASTPVAANSTLDCMLSLLALGAPSTRSLVADPLLEPGGTPLPGSPAIDFCSVGTLPVFEADILGRSRPIRDFDVPDRYGPLDVGAFEKAPAVIVVQPAR